jgi:hypothetical protein
MVREESIPRRYWITPTQISHSIAKDDRKKGCRQQKCSEAYAKNVEAKEAGVAAWKVSDHRQSIGKQGKRVGKPSKRRGNRGNCNTASLLHLALPKATTIIAAQSAPSRGREKALRHKV